MRREGRALVRSRWAIVRRAGNVFRPFRAGKWLWFFYQGDALAYLMAPLRGKSPREICTHQSSLASFSGVDFAHSGLKIVANAGPRADCPGLSLSAPPLGL